MYFDLYIFYSMYILYFYLNIYIFLFNYIYFYLIVYIFLFNYIYILFFCCGVFFISMELSFWLLQRPPKIVKSIQVWRNLRVFSAAKTPKTEAFLCVTWPLCLRKSRLCARDDFGDLFYEFAPNEHLWSRNGRRQDILGGRTLFWNCLQTGVKQTTQMQKNKVRLVLYLREHLPTCSTEISETMYCFITFWSIGFCWVKSCIACHFSGW